MARQRKGEHPASDNVPLVKPTGASNKKHKKPLIEISEEEQWRLINESGVFKIPRPDQPDQKLPIPPTSDDNTDNPTFGEEIFNTILYVVPFSFLLLMMEMYVASGLWNSFAWLQEMSAA